MENTTSDYLTELFVKCETLKQFQINFINSNKMLTSVFTAPELKDTPEYWMLEYRQYGGNIDKPAYKVSRLQKLLDETKDNSNFLEILERVKNSQDEDIIWKIEFIYKKDYNNWNAFAFSLVASSIKSYVGDNLVWKKWESTHEDGWLNSYKSPTK